MKNVSGYERKPMQEYKSHALDIFNVLIQSYFDHKQMVELTDGSRWCFAQTSKTFLCVRTTTDANNPGPVGMVLSRSNPHPDSIAANALAIKFEILDKIILIFSEAKKEGDENLAKWVRCVRNEVLFNQCGCTADVAETYINAALARI
ncbi:MAG: hypothetical protein V3T17_11310 [Pseudomonadales bacterium]